MLAAAVHVEMNRASRRARFAVLLSLVSVVISLFALAVAVHHEAAQSAASRVAAWSSEPAPLVRVPTKAEIKRAQDMWRKRRMEQ